MIVAELWRYPVKSMAGEAITHGELRAGVLVGDRAWGVVDVERGTLLSAKRWPQLLRARASHDDARGATTVWLPDGHGQGEAGEPALDAALTAWLGHAVALRRPTPEVRARIEMDELDLALGGGDDVRELVVRGTTSFETQPGSFFDSRSPLHLVTRATLAQLAREHGASAGAAARYRANLILDGGAAFDELAWVGQVVRVGALPLWIRKRTERCVLITRAQPGLDEDRPLLRHVARAHAACVGVYAHARTGEFGADLDGAVTVGQALVVAPAAERAAPAQLLR